MIVKDLENPQARSQPVRCSLGVSRAMKRRGAPHAASSAPPREACGACCAIAAACARRTHRAATPRFCMAPQPLSWMALSTTRQTPRRTAAPHACSSHRTTTIIAAPSQHPLPARHLPAGDVRAEEALRPRDGGHQGRRPRRLPGQRRAPDDGCARWRARARCFHMRGGRGGG